MCKASDYLVEVCSMTTRHETRAYPVMPMHAKCEKSYMSREVI